MSTAGRAEGWKQYDKVVTRDDAKGVKEIPGFQKDSRISGAGIVEGGLESQDEPHALEGLARRQTGQSRRYSTGIPKILLMPLSCP